MCTEAPVHGNIPAVRVQSGADVHENPTNVESVGFTVQEVVIVNAKDHHCLRHDVLYSVNQVRVTFAAVVVAPHVLHEAEPQR
jgi:hypothetical protein